MGPRTCRTVLAAFLATGCTVEPDPGTQIGSEDELHCEIVSTTILDDTTGVPEGFDRSVDEALATITGSFVGTVTGSPETEQEGVDPSTVTSWPIGTEATLTLTPSGPAELVDLEATEPADGGLAWAEDVAVPCPDYWTVGATAAWTMEDQLDEVADTELRVGVAGTADFGLQVALDDIEGPARPSDALTALDDPRLTGSAAHVDGEWRVDLSWLAETGETHLGEDGEPTAETTGEYLGAFRAE